MLVVKKLTGLDFFKKTTCVRDLGVNDSWLNDSILKTSIYDSAIRYWMRGRIIIVALFGMKIRNCIRKGFVCDSQRNGGFRELDCPKKFRIQCNYVHYGMM